MSTQNTNAKIYLQHLKLTKAKYQDYIKNVSIAIKDRRKLGIVSLQRMESELSTGIFFVCQILPFISDQGTAYLK